MPGSEYSDDSRAYTVDTYDGEHHPSYKLVVTLESDFARPRVLRRNGHDVAATPRSSRTRASTRSVGDREYLLFYEGNQLQVVGWKTEDAAYWVSNTLTGDLSEDQMIAVAESMKPFSPAR